MKNLVLRFDVDTIRCIAEGVPALLSLAGANDIKMTFYCNMGAAISRAASLERLLFRRSAADKPPTASKLKSLDKLGYRYYLETLAVNPEVGLSYPATLARILEQGHDLGLHGGLNHGSWQHGFRHWSEPQISRQVTAGVEAFEAATGVRPTLFSSPGWQGSKILNRVLRRAGFAAVGNRHGPHEQTITFDQGIAEVPTNILGEPGGVGYIEHLTSRKLSKSAVLDDFSRRLESCAGIAVAYDHPGFAGTAGIELLQTLIERARALGCGFLTTSAVLADTRR